MIHFPIREGGTYNNGTQVALEDVGGTQICICMSPEIAREIIEICERLSEEDQYEANRKVAALERMFPLQSSRIPVKAGPREIPWSIAEKAYATYSQRYETSQSLQRLSERGGFCWGEMDMFYPPWRDEISIEAKVRKLEAENTMLRNALQHFADDVGGAHRDYALVALGKKEI